MRAKKMRLLPIALVLLASYGTAWAQQTAPAATGLGQSWPNTGDVSSSPRWHVYVFERDGIRYIQVNDLNGTVRASFAAVDGAFLVLPAGVDAQRATATVRPAAMARVQSASAPETVYNDGLVKVVANTDGHNMSWTAQSTCTGRPEDCNGMRALTP